MAQQDAGYINYFSILGLDPDAKPGEVRKEYRRRMKELIVEISRAEITEERRAHFLLEMAKLNAAYYVLWNGDRREAYAAERSALIALEERWRDAAAAGDAEAEPLRREFERRLRDFLTKFIEEAMISAGRDKDVIEESNWDMAHERHAFRILRHYRQSLYQQILERLPYVDVTEPKISWDERRQVARAVLDDAVSSSADARS